MVLIYLFPFLLLLQASANPLDSTEISTLEVGSFNETTEPENGTDIDVTVMPLTNMTSMNETVMEPFESTVVDITSEATTTEDQEVVDTISYTSEPEATVSNPPPTKKANIDDGNMAVMAQAGALAFVLPVCVRLVTLWNRCL